MIKERNLDPSLKSIIQGVSLPGAAEKFYVTKDGANPKTYWQSRVEGDKNFNTPSSGAGTAITDALAAATTGQNDVIHLSPDSHTIGAKMTWDKSMTHLIGMYPSSMMNQRSRIGHNANFATMLDVTGQGNLFANLYFQYGRGNAANTNLLTVSGDRNTFYNCHFAGPLNATEGDQADLDLVALNCGEVYFNHCTFGIQTINWTNGDMIRMFGPADRSVRAIFEDCVFLMQADNAQVNFIETTAGQGAGFALFNRCQFLNVSGTALTYAIDGAGMGNFKIYADINTFFAGVTDIVAAANEANVLWGHGGYVSADKLNNMLATNPDVS